MYLVSSGKATVLSDFADLETKSTYRHKNEEATDFQFYTNSGVFVEVNKKAGLEVMRIKEIKENEIEIQRVLPLKIRNAYCVACSRQSSNEIALGLSNGEVRTYNYRKSEMLHRYTGDKLNSVVFLDFNASDEYIAAVQETGFINIFGTKTGAKLESINVDSNSTLARFHPTKRFQLAIASYKGAVTAYDISSKRKTFHSSDSHNAPCRDLCMSLASSDTLISVGYDCVINIYDTRRKGQPVKLNHNHPLSTVALSDCGTFFCVGNLKGELTTYDMRHTKAHLSNKKVHDCAVNRVAFVTEISREQQVGTISSTISSTNTTIGALSEQKSAPTTVGRINSEHNSTDARKSFTTQRHQRDSFCDFIDIQTYRGIDKSAGRLTSTGRDSFDWEVLTRKTSTNNRTSLFNIGSNLSPGNNNGCNTRGTHSFGDSFEKKLNSANSHGQGSSSEKQSNVGINVPFREQNHLSGHQVSPVGNLAQINEDQPFHQSTLENALNTSSGSDKENPHIHLELHRQVKSTPISSSPDQQLAKQNYPSSNDFQKLLDSLRSDMDARLHQLEFDLKLDAERNKWAIFTQSFDLWQQQIQNTEEIRSALSVLLQTDPFVVEFRRLKEENQALKAQIERLSMKRK